MSLSNFGVSKLTFISKDSAGKSAEITSVDSIDMAGLQSPLVQQKSGNNEFAVAVGAGEAEGTLTATIQRYSKELLEVLAPKESIITSDSSGTPAINSSNELGTSVLNNTTGLIAGLKSGAEASLKAGKYIIIGRSASTVDVISTTKDFKTNAQGVLNASPLSISSGTSVDVLDQDGNATGLELTGGSGTIAFVEGDFANVDVSKGKIALNYSLIANGGYCPRIFELVATSANDTADGKCLVKQITISSLSALIKPLGAFTKNEFSPFELSMVALAGAKIEAEQIEL